MIYLFFSGCWELLEKIIYLCRWMFLYIFYTHWAFSSISNHFPHSCVLHSVAANIHISVYNYSHYVRTHSPPLCEDFMLRLGIKVVCRAPASWHSGMGHSDSKEASKFHSMSLGRSREHCLKRPLCRNSSPSGWALPPPSIPLALSPFILCPVLGYPKSSLQKKRHDILIIEKWEEIMEDVWVW